MIGPEATQAAQTLLRNILDFNQKYVSVVLMKINITIKRFWKNVQINNRNMLNSDRIDAFEGGTDVDKTSASKEGIICH